MEKRRFADLFTKLALVTNKEADPVLMKLYKEILEKELSDQQIEYAFTEGLVAFKFFPSPADLVELGRRSPIENNFINQLLPAGEEKRDDEQREKKLEFLRKFRAMIKGQLPPLDFKRWTIENIDGAEDWPLWNHRRFHE